MNEEGPALAALVRHLADCPADFLDAPRIGETGNIYVAAVVSDLLIQLGGQALSPQEASAFTSDDPQEANRLRTILVACWLLSHPALVAACWVDLRGRLRAVQAFLEFDVVELARFARPAQWVQDTDRREELARLGLRTLGLRPAGESEAQAQDRLTTISSLERQRVIAAARSAEARSQAIRDAMAKKAAEEAAAKYSRE